MLTNFSFRWDVTAAVKEEPNLLLDSEIASPELKVEYFSATLPVKVKSEFGETSVSPSQASETDPQMSTL